MLLQQSNQLLTYSSDIIDSKAIQILRFPLAIMVVIIHLSPQIEGWNISCMTHSNMAANIVGTIMLTFSHVLSHISVPTFFLITGYLFFKHLEIWNNKTWVHKMQNRIHTILIPYFIWVTFYIGRIAFRKLSRTIILGKDIQDLWNFFASNGGILKMYWCSTHWNDNAYNCFGQNMMSTAPFPIHLWFLRNLMVILLFTPIIYFLLRKPKVYSSKQTISHRASISLIILSILYFTQIVIPVPGFSISTTFYFCLGAFFSLNKKSLFDTFYKYRIPIVIFAFIMAIILIPLDGHFSYLGNLLYPLFILPGVISIVNFAFFSIIHNKSIIDTLNRFSDSTFFIYVSHILILQYVTLILSKLVCFIFNTENIISLSFVNSHPLITLFIYCLKLLLTIVICITLYNILAKYFPKLTKILCGR